MEKFKINLVYLGEKNVIPIHFDEQEYNTLLEYLNEIKRVRESKVVKAGLTVSIKINSKTGNDIIANEDVPTIDDISVLLHLLRPFILKNELSHFGKVTNILIKEINNKHIRSLIEQYKAMYHGRSLKSIIQICINDKVVNINDYIFTYLNGLEYHRDKDKKDRINKFFEYFPGNMGRALILSAIMDMANAILETGKIVEAIFNEKIILEIKKS